MSDLRPTSTRVAIQAEVSLVDPDACKFIVDRVIHPGGPFFFDGNAASGSPLAERLFALDGVAHVLVAENVVTVGKSESVSWADLKGEVGAAIRTQLLSGIPAILHVPRNAGRGGRGDAEIRTLVQELLDTEVNRSIEAHGGIISIMGVQDGVVRIVMGGGCQGCAASSVTLRQGFEVMARRVVPEIVDIVDTTDHAAGQTPFYDRKSLPIV